MKRIVICFILFILTIPLKAQTFKKAPLNDKFERFIKNQHKSNIYHIPSPTTYYFSNEIPEKVKDIILPTRFDCRDEGILTSVKDQEGAGHCWGFAALGVIEAYTKKLGLATYDLSEHNMVTCHGFEWDEGGNKEMATAYLTRLSGPILEIQDPYSDTDFSCSAVNKKPAFYVTESKFLPENKEVLKYILMTYGPFARSMYWDPFFFNSSTNTYYYNGNEDTNHGVITVGWDDNITTSGGKGAWIVKNSWGTSWGDNGYFYMSYNDKYAISEPSIYPVRQETTEIDTILMIDYFGELSSFGFGDYHDYGLIKYHVNENYHFSKIGTYIGASNSIIDIEVFATKDGNNLTDTLAISYHNLAEYPGFQTFDVSFDVTGDFYIKIGYYTPGDRHPVPAESFASGYAIPQINQGVCWLSNKGDTWEELGLGVSDAEADLCIRAYGSKKTTKADFNSNKHKVCYDTEVTFTDNSKGEIVNYQWFFGAGANPETATNQGPHSISYSSNGFKTIKLIVENNLGQKDTIIRYNYIKVGDEIDLYTLRDEYSIKIEDTISLFAYGAESYVWTPENLIIGNNNQQSINVSPSSDTYYKITGSSGSCSKTDSILVKVLIAPENDNVCNAIQLNIGSLAGPFTNASATVEDNEPYPAGGECNAPMQWCNEGGLQNSVWFYFEAPESGAISIETDGFDNQIAIYDTESCEDIVSGNNSLYELLAANDDATDPDYSATISRLDNLTAGKTYWLQMDGSDGGKTGECTIEITALSATGVNPFTEQTNSRNIYPNPTYGELCIKTENLINQKVDIAIFNVEGNLVKKSTVNIKPKEIIKIDLNDLKKGLYILEVKGESINYRRKFIKK